MAEAAVFLLIFLVRGGVPLLILRWPFWGGLLCIAADAFDSIIQDVVGVEPLQGHYHQVDKAFDIYYLAIEAWVALHWEDLLARVSALVLFGLRLLAVALFEVTGERWLFFIGPNIFENFFLFVSGMIVLNPAFRVRSPLMLAVMVAFVGAPKVLQEYVMHYREAATFEFVKDNILLFWK